MGLFKKIGNAVNKVNKMLEEEEKNRLELQKKSKFKVINDDTTRSTSYQCPKCNSYDVKQINVVSGWYGKDYLSKPGTYDIKICKSCGYEYAENVEKRDIFYTYP
ncbi:hypothetical protein ETI01_10650 [Macrococcoides caseolyticum]|uniref:hypothetical protein n=1 Tax=Macrococcoides caseolyticum TaxID=69966 RepID=UPI00105FD19E|nr:hypothetical protein [Macrococcus caseolyticus]TDM20989.1 hypothetical protein ETI01_10650 [Macrococcus caseolyticus]